MPADQLSALKEAIKTAQTAASEIAARIPSRDSSTLVKCFSNSLESLNISVSIDSLDLKLLLYSYVLHKACWAIATLALSQDLAQININGVLIKSTLKGLKKAVATVKKANRFTKMSPDDEEPTKLYFIKCSVIAIIKSKNYMLEASLNRETLVEFSNVVILACSAITCLASKVALQYAWGDDYVCDGHHSNADK